MQTDNPLPSDLRDRLRSLQQQGQRLVIMTGAGISAESGIPTFRGEEGYWTVGAKEYHPQEMATHAMFASQPEAVWAWYLYRRAVCRAATPNAGHRAVVELEKRLGERFLLITQNVDGLHLRAGNSIERTYQIHGNIDYARCDKQCGQSRWFLPEELQLVGKGESLTNETKAALQCPRCGGWARPHVLWFDECYDDENFHFHASLTAASTADFLLVVGTSGATNLPMQVGAAAHDGGAAIVDVNPQPNPFSALAEAADNGYFLQGPSGQFLPAMVNELAA
jgi:NAD-dependent deacetylase